MTVGGAALERKSSVRIGDPVLWMSETMKDLRQRTDEVSDLERSMSTMPWNMGEVNDTLNKVTSSLAKITEGNETRDKKIDDLITSLSAGLAEREKKTEERIDNMERSLGAKMDERFSDFEKRISSIERGTGSAGHTRSGTSQGGWGPTPTNLKAVIHGFKPVAKEQEVKRIVARVLSDNGMKEEHLVDYPAIPITHVFVEFEDTRIRDRFVRSANMRRYELDERTIKISRALEPEERFEKKRLGLHQVCHQQKHWNRVTLDKTEPGKKERICVWATSSQIRKQRLPQVLQIRKRRRRSTKSHGQMVDKKLVATTVSSREIGMQRRINQVTTSSHVEKENKNDETKEETSRIHISFKTKDSKKLFFTRVKEEHTKEEKKVQQQALETQCHRNTEKRKQQKSEGLNTWKAEGEGKGSSSKASHQDRNEKPQKKTTFIVLQKTHEVTGLE